MLLSFLTFFFLTILAEVTISQFPAVTLALHCSVLHGTLAAVLVQTPVLTLFGFS